MRSKALPPARAQGHIVPFLEAAALFAALCIFARTAALMLAAAITAPLPMAETLFWLGRSPHRSSPHHLCRWKQHRTAHRKRRHPLCTGRAGADREH